MNKYLVTISVPICAATVEDIYEEAAPIIDSACDLAENGSLDVSIEISDFDTEET